MLRSLIACSLLCATPLAAEKPNEDELIQELVTELKKVVPKGWKVSQHQLRSAELAGRNSVQIKVLRSNQAASKQTTEPNHAPKSRQVHLHFCFYLENYLPPETYAKLAAENDAIDKRVAELVEGLSDIEHVDDGKAFGDYELPTFRPKTKTEQKRLHALGAYIREHPKHTISQDCYYKTVSLRFWDEREWSLIESKDLDAECDEVLAKIRTVITFYEGKEPRR